jgi:hypothetical protein
MFELLSDVPGFDDPKRTFVLDMEKGLRRSFKDNLPKTQLFTDEIHFKKNLAKAIPAKEKAESFSLYSRALREPSRDRVDVLVAKMGPATQAYQAKWPKGGLSSFFAL